MWSYFCIDFSLNFMFFRHRFLHRFCDAFLMEKGPKWLRREVRRAPPWSTLSRPFSSIDFWNHFGRSRDAPGPLRDAPGTLRDPSATLPVPSRTLPGRSGTLPGHSWDAPGPSRDAPGTLRDPSGTLPGRSGCNLSENSIENHVWLPSSL